MSFKKAEDAVVKNRKDKVENRQPKYQLQKHTLPVHTAKELITQQTCAGMTQTWLTDLKNTNLKIMTIQ